MSDKDDENQSQKANIPKINGDNFMMWTMRIQNHLCCKNLYQYCENLQESYTTPQSKKKQEATDLIIQYIDDITFECIEESGSTSSDMKTYIKECKRLMNQLAIVCIDIPNDVLSCTILAKLYTRYNHHGKDLIVKNKVLGLDEPYRLSTSESSHFNIGSVLDRNSELSKLQEGRMIKSYEENLDVY
ncbi:hypothetical protein PPACK8108_LOCUS11111 [Phakopsora pachyrhizi]|uniref:Uncharacterized protein n=1 Tax=Phakopsora pachyrhizi TaxID=170000 RepID=A0AAV0B1P9_PHAPC|nr:hypothetical protein PPACK8108_LOCUS11111 [Phakopsora pachyrhizi]